MFLKLFDVIIKVKEKAEESSETEIIGIINTLQAKLISSVFEPCQIQTNIEWLDKDSDKDTKLLLEKEFIDLYFYYIMAVLSALNSDIEAYENYSSLFHIEYSEFTLKFRKNNCPKKSVKLGGRNI